MGYDSEMFKQKQIYSIVQRIKKQLNSAYVLKEIAVC